MHAPASRRPSRPALAAWALAVLAAAAPVTAAGDVALQALHDQAMRSGHVRVLARLALHASPEGQLAPGDAVARQRGAIAVQRDALAVDLAGTDARTTRAFTTIPFVALEVDAAGLAALVRSGRVADVVEDGVYAPANDAVGASLEIVEAPAAWAAGFDGAGEAVAVLDTGVDTSHPVFAGRVLHEACFSDAGSCPGGDEVAIGPGAAAPCDYAPSVCGHGTHVAGIAVGGSDAPTGVARGAGLVAVQVFSRSFDCFPGEARPCPRAYAADYVAALEHVYTLRDTFPIAAVNLSLAGRVYRSQAFCDYAEAAAKAAIDNLRAAGIATVIAAGNQGVTDALAAPACVSSAVSVGATAHDDVIATFSSSAPFLSLLAPGVAITSALPGGRRGAGSGTSQAAPHVAGAFAVLRQHAGGASVEVLLTALRDAGPLLDDARNGVATPRLRVHAALDGLATATCACAPGVDNFCFLPPGSPACAMTLPGGYCDPDGDGDFADADWVRGWTDFAGLCGDVQPTTPEPQPAACPCLAGRDNFCFHAPATPACAMTMPGGYCDPDGDGDFADADWVRGWTDFAGLCG